MCALISFEISCDIDVIPEKRNCLAPAVVEITFCLLEADEQVALSTSGAVGARLPARFSLSKGWVSAGNRSVRSMLVLSG